MLAIETTNEDCTIAIDGYPYETPDTPWRVRSVELLPDYSLLVTFRDGLSGTVSLKERVNRANAGVFAALADPAAFADVSVVFGAVTWRNGVDLAPDAMYEELQRNGVWVLR